MHPKVSVIIPTYNREKFIGAAIESVINQSFKEFEILVVDDGSSDNTQKLIATITDPRLHYIHQENRGRSNARNQALKLAKAKYICFLDSDDLYLPNKLELQVNYMEKNQDIAMIYTSALCIDADEKMLPEKYEANVSGWLYPKIAFFKPVTITLPTVMLRREVIEKVGNFDEEMERFEDTDLWRRVSKHFYIGAISEPTCLLRTHSDNSLQSQNPKNINEALSYYVKKIFKEDASESYFLRCKGSSEIYLYYGKALMTRPDCISMGRQLLWQAVRFWPLSAFYIVAYCLFGHKLSKVLSSNKKR